MPQRSHNALTRATILTTLTASMALSACTGTSVGNPEDGEVTLRVETLPAGQTTAPGEQRSARAQALTTASGVTIDEARVHLKAVLTRGEGCGKADEREAGVGITAGLISAGEAGGGELGLDMPSGQYCQIRITLAPDADATVHVSGKRADGEAFTISSDLDRQLIFNRGQQQKLEINPGEDTLLILTFDVSSWIDADALNARATDALTISPATAPDFIAKFDKAVLDSVALAKDADADGVSDAEERADFESSDEE